VNTVANDEPLAGSELRELRVLAGFSQPALERCAGLSAGRVTNVENGRARFRRSEWSKVKRLLFEEMADRAREIAKHIRPGEGVPMATRQNRLGHSDARTTMKYTHVISEDGRKIAARFGELLTALPTTVTMAAGNA
jgi:integrase